MPFSLPRRRALLALIASATALPALAADPALLNVSYDVARELYKQINPAFVAAQKAKGQPVTVNQSHGGSSKQIGAVIGGLEADVVTMNQATDVDQLASAGLTGTDWRNRFPNGAAPYSSTMLFLVRKGNPKGIKDWSDLARPGVQVIIPNPKVTGNGRYGYLAAWGSVIASGGSEAQARELVGKIFANVPVLDGGGRGATTTFTQRGIGDVLVTFEGEVELIENEFGKGQFEQVNPSISIETEAPVALVDKVANRHGTAALAKAYLDFHWSPEAQEIIAKNNFRPRDPAVFKKHAARFANIRLFTVDKTLGGWARVSKTHFADGGIYDQIVAGIKR
ncbi:sulfate ABC transporter substrate-binding protein [Roseateles saccharophilus]|uniref:Sulfate transport system substrate-binding protein n=1 Tax=Roseateles saccharophilus TaxID=304 RepID=A0A4R3VF63_ROSSA|nr:sulfate ABC transporter substrate-binding protein [Roseateles saccharophilus]MDG0833870.1 sulfate ABC transporter substrate-binding protein [Roseateles saccharophilus]TCV02308.1 sulfate transport system substrate-binding protein [Roseateles saccharophilus]